jgi:hypothetical protein
MLMQDKAAFLCDFFLAPLDSAIDKFFHLAACSTYEMVVMAAFVQLEYGCSGFEVASNENAGFGKLHQHPVDRRQTDVDIKNAIDSYSCLSGISLT